MGISNRLKIIAAVTIAALMAVGLFFSISPGGREAASFEEVRSSFHNSDARLYDRHGKLLHELRVDYDSRKVGWASVNDVSPAFVDAVLASEDKRFYKHSGVDWLALVRAAFDNAISDNPSGASTITMQLASKLYPKLSPEGGRRSILQKLGQIKAARELENKWTKDEILEAYINLISYRGELTGISAASRGIFRKDPGGIDLPESLILACLIRSPNAPSDAVSRRAVVLAEKMELETDESEIRSAASSLSVEYRISSRASYAPHVALMLLDETTKEAKCTLDRDLQIFAMELAEHYIGPIRNKNVGDCAILVADNMTGEVLAYVGNTGDTSSARYVDGVRAKRQTGSTLKPFLYGLAFEKMILTPASILEDSPVEITTESGVYSPGNYDNTYRGPVTARTALASSLNIPAVRVINLVGVDSFIDKLTKAGISGLKDGGHYGSSLALGTADISLWELVNAYRVLANSGMSGNLTLTAAPAGKPTRVFSKEAAFLVSDILSDREARSTTFGLENPLSTRFWSAVKTGTSKDMRDNWCIGYSEKYTVGVWVGNFSGESMWNVSGITGAAPIWYEIMNYLHKDTISLPPIPPAGVISKEVTFAHTGVVKSEWFITGTEQEHVELVAHVTDCEILYPHQDAILAIDPNIPDELQKVFFEVSGNVEEVQWLLDGRLIGNAKIVAWAPETGAHRLKVVDNSGMKLDEVMFSVR